MNLMGQSMCICIISSFQSSWFLETLSKTGNVHRDHAWKTTHAVGLIQCLLLLFIYRDLKIKQLISDLVSTWFELWMMPRDPKTPLCFSREPPAALPGSGWTQTFHDHYKFILWTSLFQYGQQSPLFPRWEEKGRVAFWRFFVVVVLLLYKKKQSSLWEMKGDSRCRSASRDMWGMKQEILRVPVLTLSLCVRAATPLAWIIAMKMGMSPKGLPFPPAMLTPRASFGPWNKAKPNTCSAQGIKNWLLGLVEQGLTHTPPHPKLRHAPNTPQQTQITQLGLRETLQKWTTWVKGAGFMNGEKTTHWPLLSPQSLGPYRLLLIKKQTISFCN